MHEHDIELQYISRNCHFPWFKMMKKNGGVGYFHFDQKHVCCGEDMISSSSSSLLPHVHEVFIIVYLCAGVSMSAFFIVCPHEHFPVWRDVCSHCGVVETGMAWISEVSSTSCNNGSTSFTIIFTLHY